MFELKTDGSVFGIFLISWFQYPLVWGWKIRLVSIF